MCVFFVVMLIVAAIVVPRMLLFCILVPFLSSIFGLFIFGVTALMWWDALATLNWFLCVQGVCFIVFELIAILSEIKND